MGVYLNEYGTHTQKGIYKFTVDSASELSTIPLDFTFPGSLCFCIDTSTTYILNSEKEWVEKPCCGGGGGGGSEYADADTKDFPWSSEVEMKTNTQYYNAIAEALQTVTGESDTYTPANMAEAINGLTLVWQGTQEEYDLLEEYDDNILYVIIDDES